MILGIGVDILEVGRMERALKQKDFREQVFTPGEIAYCERKGAHSSESYAARFAAKEAVGKALGTGVYRSQLLEIEVLTDASGQPSLHFTGDIARLAGEKKLGRAFVSLSHTAGNAIAQVILEAAQ